jgi:tetratricopeptide (TPR) repeat protein
VAKHKKQPRLRFLDRVHQPASADPEQTGLQAFLKGDLSGAIGQWNAIAAPRDAVKAALAEVYFRRGLLASDPAARQADLDRAERLQPGEARITYLQGIEAHRRGELAQAVARYQTVLRADPSWPGAALLLGLATLRREPASDMAALLGSTPAIRAQLAPVQTLLQGGAPPLGAGTALDAFWHGLGLIEAGDGSALALLEDNRSLPAAHAGVIRRYYRGVAAAQTGDREAAFKAWRSSLRPDDSPSWLKSNLIALLVESDGARLDQEDLLADSPFHTILRDMAANDTDLAEQMAMSLDRAARQAAATKEWRTAAARWEKARALVSAVPKLGTPRRLHHNLAIAYESLERWHDAAEAWRALLRTRPRGAKREQTGQAADYSDAQWRWIQDRVIECYKRADTPGEAVALYRQALKRDPQDVELHMGLALALIANEQEQAATNELQRVLDIDPKHIAARLELSEIAVQYDDYDWALRLLRGAHADAPDRENVTRALVSALREQGRSLHMSLSFGKAIMAYAEGARLAPDDWEFPMDMARAYFDKKQPKQARERLQHTATLIGNDPRGWTQLIGTWAVAGDLDEARAALEQAEARPGLPGDFHLEIATFLLGSPRAILPPVPSIGRTVSSSTESLVSLAVEAIERGAARNAGSAGYRDRAARSLMLDHPAAALRWATEAVHLAPESPENLVTLGIVLGLNALAKDAELMLRSAARLARKQGKSELAARATSFIRLVGNAASLRQEILMAKAFEQLDRLGELDLFDDMDMPDYMDPFGL